MPKIDLAKAEVSLNSRYPDPVHTPIKSRKTLRIGAAAQQPMVGPCRWNTESQSWIQANGCDALPGSSRRDFVASSGSGL